MNVCSNCATYDPLMSQSGGYGCTSPTSHRFFSAAIYFSWRPCTNASIVSIRQTRWVMGIAYVTKMDDIWNLNVRQSHWQRKSLHQVSLAIADRKPGSRRSYWYEKATSSTEAVAAGHAVRRTLSCSENTPNPTHRTGTVQCHPSIQRHPSYWKKTIVVSAYEG